MFSTRLRLRLPPTHETTESDSKRCSIHARPVCGAVILPQRYTKNGEEDLEHARYPCALYANPTQQQEKLVNLVKLIGSVASAVRTQACSPLLLLLLLSHDVAVSD